MNNQSVNKGSLPPVAWVLIIASAIGMIALLFLPLMTAFGADIGLFDFIGMGDMIDSTPVLLIIMVILYVAASGISIVQVLKREKNFGILACVPAIIIYILIKIGIEKLAEDNWGLYLMDVGSGTIILLIAAIVQAVSAYMLNKSLKAESKETTTASV